MSEYYYMSSSLDENGVFIDSVITSSSEPPCENCGPVTSSIEGEYILLDSIKDTFESHLHKGTISFSEEERLHNILLTQRYKEEDREFLQHCADKLIGG